MRSGKEGKETSCAPLEVGGLPVGLARRILRWHDRVRDDLAASGRMARAVRHVGDQAEALAVFEEGLPSKTLSMLGTPCASEDGIV